MGNHVFNMNNLMANYILISFQPLDIEAMSLSVIRDKKVSETDKKNKDYTYHT